MNKAKIASPPIWFTDDYDDEILSESNDETTFRQYIVSDNETSFQPAGRTICGLPPGAYTPMNSQGGVFYSIRPSSSTDLMTFEGSGVDEIFSEFGCFWSLREKYESLGMSHKRGYLLHGPPGCGKTSAVELMMRRFIDMGGIVLNFSHMIVNGYETLRRIEPNRKIMIVIEDIDGLIMDYEETILQFLDGHVQLTNTVVIATTNHIDRLPNRIKNRPSRIDRIVQVEMPNKNVRHDYLVKHFPELSEDEVGKYLKDTHGLSLAHLKEIIVSVKVFGNDYDPVIKRVQMMSGTDSMDQAII